MKKKSFLRRFWAKETRHSETISDKECCLYRSMLPTFVRTHGLNGTVVVLTFFGDRRAVAHS